MKTKTATEQWQNIEGRINLAGVQFSDYQRLSSSVLKAGLVLTLVGEPNNPHDNKAVRVEHAGVSLGYIPAKTIWQSEVWHAHRTGYKCIAVLTAFNKNNPSWSMITVQLKRKLIRSVVSKPELMYIFL